MKTKFLFISFLLFPTFLLAQGWSLNNGNLFTSDYVGIGIVPEYKLDVNGRICLRQISVENGKSVSYLNWTGHILNAGTPTGIYAYNYFDLKPGGANEGVLYSFLRMYTALSPNNQIETIHFTSNGDCWLNTGGRLGIGTVSPNYTLDVQGTIRANEIIVNTSGADFVFDDKYELMSLAELQAFIKAHHHLPNIEDAIRMQENGVAIGELQTLFLEKIEELTLYVLQQQKTIEDLTQKINELNNL